LVVGFVAWSLVARPDNLFAQDATPTEDAARSAEGERFFEEKVRPIFAEHCQGCHGARKEQGGLRLDSWKSITETSDSAPVIVPGDLEGSLLVRAVRREAGYEMPPDGPLKPEQVEAIEHWVKIGAPWPQQEPIASDEAQRRAREHWAFQPIRSPQPPSLSDTNWVRNPVDAFVLDALRKHQLQPSPQADKRTLIRRATYLVTGLPPTQEAIDRFLADNDPTAYATLVEELLKSPQYGEQWARLWLDVARYSDSKGYVYAREHRFWTHAWSYRDWVADAFNRDRPYDEFLLMQLAADRVATSPADLAAMGFLTLGRRFLGVRHDIIDDRIDAVSRGMMGLTVACARCHDHKYDPIPTADYYSLHGVFDSCLERERSLAPPETLDPAYAAELQKRQETLAKRLAEIRKETSDRVRERIADYFAAQFELDIYPAENFNQLVSKKDLLATIVHRWNDHLREAGEHGDPIFVAWHRIAPLAEGPDDAFAEASTKICQQLLADPDKLNPLIAQQLVTPPMSSAELAAIYGKVFADVRQKVVDRAAAEGGADPSTPLDDPAAEPIRQLLYGPRSPCEIPDESIVEIEYMLDIDGTTELWKLQAEVDRHVIDSGTLDPRARVLVDREVPAEPRIFRRGNPLRKEAAVPRQFLALLSGENRQPFRDGSGRVELARAIIDPTNPLTARVIVNRVWGHYFGSPLVETPSDFGLRAAPPSHPELLDWLASGLIADNWSLKQLHRKILLSATFCQSGSGPTDAEVLARAQRDDPANRWLWHWQPRRLTIEEMRDTLVAATGSLDLTVGGKPIASLWTPPYSDRRTLYGMVDRQFLPGLFRVFDFANPDLHIPQRAETTAPQQALFFLNHPLVLDRANQLVQKVRSDHPGDDEASIKARVISMFRSILQRNPSDAEIAEAFAFVSQAAAEASAPVPATRKDWSYGFGELDESAWTTRGFTPLPHFTGDSWQGGPQFPDGKLGWVKLDATGGHPGNDRAHAVIRRWTAPRAMRIEIGSTFQHEPPQGDGVRAAVVTSHGATTKLAFEKFHMNSRPIDLPPLDVVAGQTVDFIVDIGDGLSYDQFLWRIKITGRDPEGGAETVWGSSDDFGAQESKRLDPWGQLAQVLLCTNEFLFVD
jgi:mono/diheme cytochrome c family protein